MKVEDLTLLSQLIESMELAVKELEKALERKDSEKIQKSKKEILNFQKEMAKIIG